MKKNFKKISMIILVLVAIISVFFIIRYWVDVTTYFTTNNASVTADMVKITPSTTGDIAQWNVKEGDQVTEGQVLGRQDVGDLVQNNIINSTSLEQTAGTITSNADIKTPISGEVVRSDVIVGETVSPGMQVAVVADTDNMYINANIEETEINRIKVGQEVEVEIDAYPGVKFTGYVESIGEATQSAFSTMPTLNTSGTYTKVTQLVPVKINVMGMEGYDLRLGYNATVKIKTN